MQVRAGISSKFFIIGLLSVLFWILSLGKADSGPYLNSAHGNASYGVNRSSTATYTKGHCAHCHEQHASIGGEEPEPAGGPDKFLLMAPNFSGNTAKPYVQSDSVCFYCHYGAGTLQSPAFYNYSYSITFGGNTDTTPNNIFDAFNSTSYHNLYDVYRLITGLSGSKTFLNFPAESNPCSGCHNVHIAKKSCGRPGAIFYDAAKSAISRPANHNSLWGDDDGERLNPNFTTQYQSPYWYGSSSNYEPEESNDYDGSNLPDYNTFCTDCHSASNTVNSSTVGRNLRAVDWITAGGDKHGRNNADVGIDIDDPYASSLIGISVGFVLSCTDCHEPHGAPNVMLIRKEVNGGVLSGPISLVTPPAGACTLNPAFPAGSKELGYLCNRCHMDDAEAIEGTANKWCYIHHESTDKPYALNECGRCHSGEIGEVTDCVSATGEPINCNCCHFHGSNDNAAPFNLRSNRRTF